MFVSHIFATQPTLPPMPACLYQYVVGENGIFLRAKRPGLEVVIPVFGATEPVRGLAVVAPYVRVPRLVPRYQLEGIFLHSWQMRHKEVLFYLQQDPWRVELPNQIASPGGVRPVNPFAGGTETILEVHSHHRMDAYFSSTDNREERFGFRLYAVLGRLDQRRPEIRARVGVYGHFWEIPARWVFDLPSFVKDAVRPEFDQEVVYEDPIQAA